MTLCEGDNDDYWMSLCEKNGVHLVPFDDGHTPLNFKDSSNNAGLLARRSDNAYMDGKGLLHVCEEALSPHLADEIYQTTVHSVSNNNTWGEYVTIEEAKERAEEIRRTEKITVEVVPELRRRTTKEIAIDAVAQYFVLKLSSDSSTINIFINNKDIHGVAVWVLAAHVNSEVKYHIDYAELIRFQYNITYPPLYGATVHCSRLCNDNNNNAIHGGDFVAFMEGFTHYERHGYKGRKQPVDYSSATAAASTTITTTKDAGSVRVVPYKFNQGILIHGEIPHLSTPITYIEPSHFKRVIMGFNVFDTIIGPIVALAPEHSTTFKRRIKIYQAISSSPVVFDLKTILKNKPLAKLLVQARREKLKRQFKQQQHQLRSYIVQLYLEHGKESSSSSVVITSDYLFDALSQMDTKSEAADIHYAIDTFFNEKQQLE